MTQPDPTDDLIAQISALQAQVDDLNGQLATANADRLSLAYQLEQAQERERVAQSVISTVTVRQGALSHRNQRLRTLIETPPKPFGQMTKPELLAYLQTFVNKITTPVPDNPNDDTV